MSTGVSATMRLLYRRPSGIGNNCKRHYFTVSTESSVFHDDMVKSIRELCKKFGGDYWREKDQLRQYPTEFVTELTNSGYLSMLIPEKYGGSGLGLNEGCLLLEEIHRSGCNGGAAHAQLYTMSSLLQHGSEKQKKKFLPKIASGKLRLQAFGISEPDSGTDTTSLSTSALPDGPDHYVINGTKIWTSRAEHSDLMLMLARTSNDGPKTKRLSMFLIDMRQALEQGSLSIKPIDTMINHSTCIVHFDNVRVPRDMLIGNVGEGFRYVLSSMNAERILIASECIGDGKFFIDKAVAYANTRNVFDRPISMNQGVQFPIAKAYANIRAAELLVKTAASLHQAGQPCGPEANMAKLLASEASWSAAEACMNTHGGFAFAREYDIERKWREARLYQIAPISSNMILNFVSQHVLGMPKSY